MGVQQRHPRFIFQGNTTTTTTTLRTDLPRPAPTAFKLLSPLHKLTHLHDARAHTRKGVWDGVAESDDGVALAAGLSWWGCASYPGYTPAPTPTPALDDDDDDAEWCVGACPAFDFLRNGYNLDYATEVYHLVVFFFFFAFCPFSFFLLRDILIGCPLVVPVFCFCFSQLQDYTLNLDLRTAMTLAALKTGVRRTLKSPLVLP